MYTPRLATRVQAALAPSVRVAAVAAASQRSAALAHQQHVRQLAHRPRDRTHSHVSGCKNYAQMGQKYRSFHCCSLACAPLVDDSTKRQLRNDANRVKRSMGDAAADGKEALSGVGADIKEGAQQVMEAAKDKAQKVKRKVKEWTEDVADSMSSDINARPDWGVDPISASRAPGGHGLSGGPDGRGVDRSGVKLGNTGVGEARDADGFNAVSGVAADSNQAARMQEQQEWANLQDGATMSARETVGPTIRESLIDGPQEMPLGVGKRARSADGKPMETGTQGS